jgi:hypothetical protein
LAPWGFGTVRAALETALFCSLRHPIPITPVTLQRVKHRLTSLRHIVVELLSNIGQDIVYPILTRSKVQVRKSQFL